MVITSQGFTVTTVLVRRKLCRFLYILNGPAKGNRRGQHCGSSQQIRGSAAVDLVFKGIRGCRKYKMGRSPCCSKEGLNRGAWTKKEDMILSEYIRIHGDGGWRNIPKKAGLKRCGKSCRLRWLNYLRPDIKRGNISPDEEELIVRLHRLLGNRYVDND